jgi:hypothetical protein
MSGRIMLRRPSKNWSESDLPWWSLAVIAVLTLLLAAITG